MPRFKLAVVLATALVCLAISSTSHTANAAVANIAPRAEDLDSVSPIRDLISCARWMMDEKLLLIRFLQ